MRKRKQSEAQKIAQNRNRAKGMLTGMRTSLGNLIKEDKSLTYAERYYINHAYKRIHKVLNAWKPTIAEAIAAEKEDA